LSRQLNLPIEISDFRQYEFIAFGGSENDILMSGAIEYRVQRFGTSGNFDGFHSSYSLP